MGSSPITRSLTQRYFFLIGIMSYALYKCMDKNILIDLVEAGNSQREIAKELDVSQTTIKYWLKKFELHTKCKQFASRPELKCSSCNETDQSCFYKSKDGYVRSWCKKCHNKYAVKRFRKYKAQAVAYKGGECEVCGYKKCLGSLDFHHKNPASKDLNWNKMRHWKFEKVKKELDKCVLVCRNCHGEIHYGDSDM